MTQIESAQRGQATPEVVAAAAAEKIDAQLLRERVARGEIVLLSNSNRKAKGLPSVGPCAIGLGMRTKVNANIGTSEDFADIEPELNKLKAAIDAGADTLMDLSTGGELPAIRRRILEASPVPVGSVPIYDAAVTAVRQMGNSGIRSMKADDMLQTIRDHAEQGMDFLTVHCGVTREVVRTADSLKRVCGIVSRGGSFLAAWMRHHGQENPFYERFDEVLGICHEYDVVLSLGDGLRPGALADAMDRAQVHELNVLAELALRAKAAGVQAMIEGPGHVPLNQVQAQVQLQKSLCNGAPFYVLGPLVTDVAPGYDHITSAIGGAVAAAAGVDFICYVTPAEHLGLPDVEHVREGVIAARIAAHAGDIAKGIPGAADWDRAFSERRRARDWDAQFKMCMDPRRARALREKRHTHGSDICSMCGDFCVFKVAENK